MKTLREYYEIMKTHNFRVNPEWLNACGIYRTTTEAKKAGRNPDHVRICPGYFEPLEVLSINNFYAHNGVCFIQVSTPLQPKNGWCVETSRGTWVEKKAPVPEETRKAIAENRQVVIPADKYNNEFIAEVPPRDQWSIYNPPTMREAKRAVKQLEKILRQGDFSLEWFEGWANAELANRTPLFSFGTFSSGKWEQKPNGSWGYSEDKSGFQNWLYGMVERMGWEATDQDQTSRCDGCNLAIDTGSSTPDRFSVSCGSILCERCCNEDPCETIRNEIRENGIHFLSWKPEVSEWFNHRNEIVTVVFQSRDRAEHFARHYTSKLMAILPGHYSWDTAKAFFFTEDAKFNCEGNAFYARIDWSDSRKNGGFERERQDKAWTKVTEAITPEDAPILFWLAEGWVDEGVLFENDMDLIERLCNELEIIKDDLRLITEELEEN